jgi:hypothetical protein
VRFEPRALSGEQAGTGCTKLAARSSQLAAITMTIRRLKTYTGSQGYAYQYYFVGKRPAAASGTNALSASEYIFDVTSDRKLTYAVSVFLPVQAAAAWAESHGRSLSDSEQYGAVKMRLFRAFDELEDMRVQGRELQINLQSLEEALAALGVD